MVNVLLVIHLLIIIAMIGIILLQRSEGGGLGSSSSGLDSLLSSHSKANFFTRLTAILAACFMASSLGLAILANRGSSSDPIVEETTPISPEDVKEAAEPPVPFAN